MTIILTFLNRFDILNARLFFPKLLFYDPFYQTGLALGFTTHESYLQYANKTILPEYKYIQMYLLSCTTFHIFLFLKILENFSRKQDLFHRLFKKQGRIKETAQKLPHFENPPQDKKKDKQTRARF